MFISNERRACPLWQQRACNSQHEPIFWDYHVVLLCRGLPSIDSTVVRTNPTETSWYVYDLDSLLGMPVTATCYLKSTFLFDEYIISQAFEPRFRIVDAETFLRTFSSDRRHMILPTGLWQAPPPSWSPIVQGPTPFNLMQFVDVQNEFYGTVADMAQFVELFCEPAIC